MYNPRYTISFFVSILFSKLLILYINNVKETYVSFNTTLILSLVIPNFHCIFTIFCITSIPWISIKFFAHYFLISFFLLYFNSSSIIIINLYYSPINIQFIIEKIYIFISDSFIFSCTHPYPLLLHTFRCLCFYYY